MSERWEFNEMLQKAARGLGKVDALGPRGATLVSHEEIEAMAGALAVFGLNPIPPGAPTPENILIKFEEAQS